MPGGFYSRAEIEQIVRKILSDTPTAGKVYFVDPVNGADANHGETPKKAKRWTQTAVDLCSHGNNDVIFRLPGDEDLDDGMVTLNKRTLHLIGISGLNRWRPENCTVRRFGADATVATGDATGPAVKATHPCIIRGMGFYADWVQDEGVAYPGQSGSDLEFDGEGGGFAGNFCDIEYCQFPGWGESGGIFLWAGAFTLIEQCSFAGMTYGCKMGATPSNNPTDIQWKRNRFAGCSYGIDTLLGCTFHNAEVGPENLFYSSNAKAMTNAIRTRSLWNYGLICRNCIGLAKADAFDEDLAGMQAQHVEAVCNCYTDGLDPRS